MGQAEITLKRGGTLRLDCQLRSVGVPVSLAGWQIDCWLRAHSGRLVTALAVELTDAEAGRYALSGDSAAWPVGHLLADVRYADATGRVMHSATFGICVLEAVTTPEA